MMYTSNPTREAKNPPFGDRAMRKNSLMYSRNSNGRRLFSTAYSPYMAAGSDCFCLSWERGAGRDEAPTKFLADRTSHPTTRDDCAWMIRTWRAYNQQNAAPLVIVADSPDSPPWSACAAGNEI